MTVNRIDEVMKKLEREKALKRVLKSRKTFEKHLNAAATYISRLARGLTRKGHMTAISYLMR